METKLEMSPAQIYTYLSDYNNSVWDRILSGRSFDDLTDNIRRTGILEDTIGQTVLTAYRQCEPDIPAIGSLDGNILFHLLKDNALAMTYIMPATWQPPAVEPVIWKPFLPFTETISQTTAIPLQLPLMNWK